MSATKQDGGKKHLTLHERQTIEKHLGSGKSFSDIAKHIGKVPTTIAREVMKRSVVLPLKNEDEATIIDNPCPLLLKARSVCNPCEKRNMDCGFHKRLYIAKDAHSDYEALLKNSRR